MKNSFRQEKLKDEIIKTVIWFSLFRQVLTSYEIYKFVKVPASYSEILDSLEDLKHEIREEKGFFYLKSDFNIINDRFKKFNYFKKKTKKAQRFSRLVSFWPFIKGMAVANIMGDYNLRKGSDIDILLISSPGRIWLSRFVCVFWAKILGLRPNIKTKKDKICLSFYISSDNLNLKKQLYSSEDLYFIYWIANLEIIYDENDIFSQFYKANNWIKEYLPNFSFSEKDSFPNNEKKKIFFKLGFIEKILKFLQLKIMPKELKEQEGFSDGVILKDNIIKLFLKDRRPFFIERYNKAIYDRKN
jgi:hypothetical protein